MSQTLVRVFFQWVNQEPRGKTRAWLGEGRFHGTREGYPRSQELFIPQQKNSRGRRPKFGKERKKEREGRKNLDKGNVSIQSK